MCTLMYTALGTQAVGKEYVEVYCDGTILVIDDFKEFKVYGAKQRGSSSRVADKGYLQELIEWVAHLKGERLPISVAEMIAAIKVSYVVQRSVVGQGAICEEFECRS